MRPILCLESNWDGTRASSDSIYPLIELVAREYKTKSVHLMNNTLAELEHNLTDMSYGFTEGLLYLSFHGYTGVLLLGDGTKVSMAQLAGIMGRRFAGWHIHFGACRTLRGRIRNIVAWKKQTGARIVSGYDRQVDWIESAALDMLFMAASQNYKQRAALKKFMRREYRDLMEGTGLHIY